jgi:nucleoside-diphosphate-sugar epimerase
MTNRHLVTGATGFVGAACVLELLAQTSDHVICLARGNEPQARVFAALSRATLVYGVPALSADVAERVTVIAGDIADPAGFAVPADAHPISHVWHLAASLKYRKRDAEEIHATNVGGTRALLAVARQLGVRRFVYVSTAYVAGANSGTAYEVSGLRSDVNNEYEASKRRAEEEVLSEENRELQPLVLRPSIVVGHRTTHGAVSAMGPYGFAESIYKLRHEGPAHIRELFASRPMRMVAHAGTELNFVPVDRVASAAVCLGLADTSRNIFHLTNRSGITVGDCFAGVCGIMDIPVPEFLADNRSFEAIDQLLAKKIEFYAPYMLHTRTFDQTNTAEVLGSDYFDCPYDGEEMSALIKWFREFFLEAGSK